MTKESQSAKPTNISATEDVPHNKTSSSATTTSSSDSSNQKTKFDAHHRFVGWSTLLFCSVMALASKVTDTWNEESRGKDDWFVIVVSSISIGCAFFAIMGYAVARWKFPGSVFEGFFAILAQIAWICGMPVIMDPDRSIAVSKGSSYQLAGQNIILENSGTDVGSSITGQAAEFSYIRNANIYFFSWASTIAIVYICGRFARAAVRRSHKLASWTGLWYLACLASLVVLVDSTKLFVAFECHDQDEQQQADSSLCSGTAYAMGLGSLGTLLSLISSILATVGMLPQCLELIVSLLVFGAYMAGVTIITFNDGPGTSIGNLYFATWMGAGVTAVLLGRAYYALVQHYLHRHDDNKNKHKKDEEQKLPDDVPTEQPVVFPDIEMGGNDNGDDDDNKAKEENDDDGAPSWVKEEPEVHASASVPPPSATGKKPEGEEEEGVEVEANVASKKKNEGEEVEEGKAGEETEASAKSKKGEKKEDEKAEESSGASEDDQGNKTETDKGSKEEEGN